MDVLSDVCFGPKNQGLSPEECERNAREALELVGFPEKYYRQSPFELSGGQKRRVAIAGVLAMKPKVLILDEPTAGLDPKGRDEILDQIDRLHDETGMTVVLVSHSMEDVARYVDRPDRYGPWGKDAGRDAPGRCSGTTGSWKRWGLCRAPGHVCDARPERAGI